MAKPIFEVDYRKRTFMSTDGVLPTINGNPELRRGEKGFSVANSVATDGLSYEKTIPNGTYSVVIWIKQTETANQYFFDCRDSGGVGYTRFSNLAVYASSGGTHYANNVIAVTPPAFNQYVCYMLTGATLEASRIDIGTRYTFENSILPGGGITYFAIYEGTFTATEQDKLYQDFLNAPGPTSIPTIIRHKIPVDPTGSVLCHDYQFPSWRGGVVPDLSGSGNNGICNGFVDVSNEGVRFSRVSSYINSGQDASLNITNNLSIELYAKASSGDGEYILDKGVTASKGYAVRFGETGGDKLRVLAWGTGFINQQSTVDVCDDQWHYIVVTYSNPTLSIYIDGKLDKATTEGGNLVSSAGKNLLIGKSATGLMYGGCLKFTKLHNSILTETQIKNRWNSVAKLVNLNVLGENLLPDGRIYTANQRFEI